MRVVRVDAGAPDSARRLDELRPNVAIVDSTIILEQISALRQCPGLVLIGVDVKTNELLVLSGEPSRPLTLENLVQLINAGGSPDRGS
jgi:hypothetical protein